jgi:hypothetical protein
MGRAIAVSRRGAGCASLSAYSSTANTGGHSTNEKEIRIRIAALTLKL